MSLGELHAEGAGCGSSAMHQAMCNLVDEDVTVVAAAGNNAIDAESFFPAAYPEVIAVSAFSDLDGARSFAGCSFYIDIFNQCDDTLASFTNFGSVIDVAAPGVRVYSTTFDGAWGLNSGTSMASPHVAGVAALVLAADPTLSPGEVRDILRSTGECPDGAVANAPTCAGHGQWQMSAVFGGTGPDPDGIPEPLVDALGAAEAAAAGAGGGDTPPSASITAPADGTTVSGTVPIEVAASDAEDAPGTLSVEWSVDGGATWTPASWDGDSYDGSWDSGLVADGPASIVARATDSAANTTSASPVDVTVDNIDAAPTAVIDAPSNGATVSGTVPIEVTAADAEDPAGALTVEWRLAGGSWQLTTWDGSAYTAAWDSTTGADVATTIEARATDSADHTTNAPTVTVTVDNIDEAPSAAITAPADGATVSGVVPIEITASDAEDAEGALIVEWSVDGGVTWSPAPWNGSTYAGSWDTTGEPEAPATIQGRAADSAMNTTSATSVVVTVANGPAPSVVDDYAGGESATLGTVSGSYQDTHGAGGGTEAITEEESGGKPDNRTSQLDHTWTISVTGGEVVTFIVDATANDQGDGEGFTFAYSTDGATFTDMLIVDATTTDSMSYVLPPSTQGEVTIRVIDTDRGAGNRSLETLWIDHMYIRSESPGPGVPPVAPGGVVATGVGDDMVAVSWSDGSGGSAAFEIERRVAGGPWALAGVAPAGSVTFIDTGLTPDTTYDYRVRAYSAEGVSTWSEVASGTTLAAPLLVLDATGYKVKGVQHAELVWSGAVGVYDVFRDDALIATVPGTTYTDNIGVKGGGSYTYRVCEAGTMVCSNAVEVTF